MERKVGRGRYRDHIRCDATWKPDYIADPANRLFVAIALEGHRLITAEERILDWDGDLNRLAAFS